MSKIIVTGGLGFIASHLVDRLISLKHEVFIWDNLSTGKRENLNPKAVFTGVHDIKNKDVYITEPTDYIFHLAALPSVPYSVENPIETHDVNINGTLNILEFAKNYSVKKVIFASSSAVYGDQELPLTEDKPTKPKSPYAFHKAVGEGYMRLFTEVYDLPTISLRFFNVYGPRADPENEYSLVISKFLKQKQEGKHLTIYGDGEQSRDFVYVDDVVDALIAAMEKGSVKSEEINICSGERITINKIADLIGGEKDYLPIRKGDVLHTLGSNSKAKRLLNWKPKTSMEDGIRGFKAL